MSGILDFDVDGRPIYAGTACIVVHPDAHEWVKGRQVVVLCAEPFKGEMCLRLNVTRGGRICYAHGSYLRVDAAPDRASWSEIEKATQWNPGRIAAKSA